MSCLVGPFSSGLSTGGAGASTANASSTIAINGKVMGIYLKHNDSPPAGTTDVTVKTVGTSPRAPSYNLLARVNSATDGWFYPRVQVHDTAGVAISAQYTPLMVADLINVLIAQANDGDSVDVWLLIDPRAD